MIDTHIHLLPAVDDGANDLEISRQMAKRAVDEGISQMIVTPHFVNNIDYQTNARQQFELLSQVLEEENISLKIRLGNEIHLSEENVEAIFSGVANTMAGSDYVLIELPTYHFYEFHEAFLYNLLEKGYKIILAHIERYRIFEDRPEKLGQFIEAGMFAQVTAKYLIERKTRKKGIDWIKTGWVHIVATDAHDIKYRPPQMKKAYEIIEGRFGECAAIRLFKENPRAVIENRPIDSVMVSQKRWRLF
ncbi:CpsB/CapC family capsule biosynthesis tyrosine phosphatase [Eubacteriaceae bacterium ES3]|nr:CpsB/CapC family capsule biosynthesis tyrosine phosphatase [Eubacteriaceae bacterium ES3]